MTKPLVRWTLGPCESIGQDCLFQSILLWRSHYGDKWNYVVCYNGNAPLRMPYFVKLINQYDYLNHYNLLPEGPAWKLYPTRIEIDTHEIIIDNDVLLYKPHPFIDFFINSSSMNLTTEAWERCYGSFNSVAPLGTPINTGFIGMCPGFNLQEKIQYLLNSLGLKKWETHFCEQGVVATALSQSPLLIIPRADLPIGVPSQLFHREGYGFHFVGINKGYDVCWNDHLKVSML